ncbi:MAG: hypothetical protein ABFS23_00675 [Pseudomonadota bacterium]
MSDIANNNAHPVAKERHAQGYRRLLNRVSSEVHITTGQLIARFDFEQQWLTVAFRPWFDWHVDTAEVSAGPGLVYFVEPDGETVGIKIFQQAAATGDSATTGPGGVARAHQRQGTSGHCTEDSGGARVSWLERLSCAGNSW